MPEIDVIVATKNRHAPLVRCLTALAAQTHPDYGVIVIDDGSDVPAEQAVPAALRAQLDVRFIRRDSSQGPARARNDGIALSEAPYIAFIDDDVCPVPEVLQRHYDVVANADGPLASVGPLLAPADWEPEPWTLWEARQLAVEYDRIVAGEYAPNWRQFHTGNALIRREDFIAAGGFDEQLIRAEDVELALRMELQGCGFVFLPDAIGWHYAQRTLEAWLAIPRRYGACHVSIDDRHPGVGWIDLVLSEQATRHPLLRIARRVAARPATRALTSAAGVLIARALHRVRAIDLSMWALSAVYDIEYNAALHEALRRPRLDTVSGARPS